METNELRYIVVSQDGKNTFPLTMVQIASRVRRGVIKPDTMLTSTDGTQSHRAGDIPDLAAIFEQKGVRNVPPAATAPTLKKAAANTPITPDPSKAATFYIEEASRQYKTLNSWLILGVLFFPAMFGIFMVIYACVQKPALRRRVAELGVDPVAWARPLDGDLQRKLGYVGLFVICALFLTAFWVSATNEARNGYRASHRSYR